MSAIVCVGAERVMQARFVRFVGSFLAIPAPPLDAPLAGLDSLRRWGLTTLGPSFAQAVMVDRDKRTAFFGCLLISSAFLSSSTFPVVMLLLGPLLWGVPHILSDLRYLVARPGLHKRPLALGAIGFGVVAASFGFGVRGGLAGAALALLVAETSWKRRLWGLSVVGTLFAVAQRSPFLADLAFAHLHNFIGVLVWWAWRPRQTRLHWLPITLFVAFSMALVAGAATPLHNFTRGLEAPWTGLSMHYLCSTLTPFPRDPLAVRLVLLFAFAQATHYVVWLRLVPEDDRPSKSPRSYVQSFRAATEDLGSILIWLSVLTALGLIGWAFVQPGAARDGYLRLASFHGHLELGAAALLWAEGRLGFGRQTANA